MDEKFNFKIFHWNGVFVFCLAWFFVIMAAVFLPNPLPGSFAVLFPLLVAVLPFFFTIKLQAYFNKDVVITFESDCLAMHDAAGDTKVSLDKIRNYQFDFNSITPNTFRLYLETIDGNLRLVYYSPKSETNRKEVLNHILLSFHYIINEYNEKNPTHIIRLKKSVLNGKWGAQILVLIIAALISALAILIFRYHTGASPFAFFTLFFIVFLFKQRTRTLENYNLVMSYRTQL